MSSHYYLLDNPNPHASGGFHGHTSRRACRHGFHQPHLAVIHTAENLPDYDGDDTGAERVAAYAASTSRAASWHSTVDSDSIIPMLPDEYLAYHVKGFNTCGLGVEIATQAHRWGDGPDEWEEAALRNAASVVARWCRVYSLSPVRLSKEDVEAGRMGVVAHHTLDPKRRSDPGKAFPWDRFLGYVKELLDGAPVFAPSEEPTVVRKVESKPSSKGACVVKVELPVLRIRAGYGSKGEQADVKRLQALLSANGESNGGYDGLFGGRTQTSVKRFQARHGLEQDGIVGKNTWTKLLGG